MKGNGLLLWGMGGAGIIFMYAAYKGSTIAGILAGKPDHKGLRGATKKVAPPSTGNQPGDPIPGNPYTPPNIPIPGDPLNFLHNPHNFDPLTGKPL